MTITKGSLRNFMDEKFREAEKGVREEIDVLHEPLEKHLTKELEAFKPIVKAATKLGDDLVRLLEEKGIDEWLYNYSVSDARDISKISNRIKKNKMNDIRTAVRIDRHFDTFGMKDLVERAKKDAKPLYDKIGDIERLSREVESVILNATSGKKAHRDLISLGIDMSDYEEENANLPSIQKLSVDPCLVNGNCD